MTTLHTLQNTTRPHKNRKRVGRGVGSGTGKTCGRGEKGAGSRSGYRRRHGYEGGQMRLFMKMPTRGFSRVRFRKAYDVINLGQLESLFKAGETVTVEALKQKGLFRGPTYGIKLLGHGELKKKLNIQLHAVSQSAATKLQDAHASVTIVK